MGNQHIKLSSSNLSNGKSVVRIYLNYELIVEEEIPKRNPVPYLRKLIRSKHLINIEKQLLTHGLTLKEVGLR